MTIPLYLHIPKCGGSTVTNVIYQQCSTKTSGGEKTKYWHRGVYFYPAGLFSRPSSPSNPEVGRMLKRPDLRAVVGHFSFGIHQHVTVPSVYVTVMRDPVSRILSLYDELKRQKRIDMTLDNFVLKAPFPDTENDQARRIAGTGGEQMLEIAIRNLTQHFAVVGITEQMDETLFLMHHTFGWSNTLVSYPKNVSFHRTDPNSVADDIRRLIVERNSLDVALYRIAQENFKKTIHKQGPEFQAGLANYKASVKSFIDQANIDALSNADSKKVHEIVLDIINEGKSRS
jgi:hypothetical protein